MKFNKAQSAIEFVILVGAVLFFFTVFFLAVQENMSDKIREKYNIAIKEVALTVQDEINFALKSSNGYFREFKISESIEGKTYEISIIEDMVYVKTTDGKYAISLPVAPVVGQPKKDNNEITRVDNVIYLNENPPNCVYGEWVSQGCGIKNCSAEQMYQNRTYSGTGDCPEYKERCVEDASCKFDCNSFLNITDAVSHWKFDVNFTDSIDNNHGKAYGNASIGGSGDYANKALILDGDGGYIDAGSNENIHFAQSKNYTFLVWFKARGNMSFTYILSDGHYSYDGWGLTYYLDNRVYFGPGSGYPLVINTSVLSLNQWYHIAAVYDSNAGAYPESPYPRLQLYLNGDLTDSAYSPQGFSASTGNFTMGAYLYENFSYFNGAIDEVMVYNRSLSPAEISCIYNNQTRT